MTILSLQVESENADLKLQVVLVTKERDSVIQRNQGLQTKLENLEQVLKVSRAQMRGLSGPSVLVLDGTDCLCFVGVFLIHSSDLAILWRFCHAGSWDVAFQRKQKGSGKAAAGIWVGGDIRWPSLI